jgi:hypothetical protein
MIVLHAQRTACTLQLAGDGIQRQLALKGGDAIQKVVMAFKRWLWHSKGSDSIQSQPQ